MRRLLASVGCFIAVAALEFAVARAAAPIDLTTPALSAKGAAPASSEPRASLSVELKTPALAAKGAATVAPGTATIDSKTGTIDIKTPPLQATGL